MSANARHTFEQGSSSVQGIFSCTKVFFGIEVFLRARKGTLIRIKRIKDSTYNPVVHLAFSRITTWVIFYIKKISQSFNV